jgi:hypothetical protein
MAVAQDADLRGNMNTACLTSLKARRLSRLAGIIDWLSQVCEPFLPRLSIGVLAQAPYRSQSIDKRGEEALPAYPFPATSIPKILVPQAVSAVDRGSLT